MSVSNHVFVLVIHTFSKFRKCFYYNNEESKVLKVATHDEKIFSGRLLKNSFRLLSLCIGPFEKVLTL